MGRKVPAPAAETPVAPSQAPAAKSRPRSPSQPSTARPVLRSRRSVSLSRQSDSPTEAALSAPRFIDVVRASLSPDASRKGSGRHSGQDKSKGRGKGKRSPSREERAPAVELTPRESIKPSQTSERRHSGGKGKRPESRDAERRHSGGNGKGKSKDYSRDAGPRPSAMDSAFERPEYGVSSAFVYCLWMIWSGFFKFSEEALNRIYESELYDKISRELSWILRHSGWTHADQSLSIFELMAGARFRKLLSVWAHTCHAKEDSAFPAVQKAQIQPWCEASAERINLLLPLAITIMYNQKGRYQVGILSTSDHQMGEKFVSNPSQWIHPAGMTAEDRKELAQLYKQYRAAHVFAQAVSSHSGGAATPLTGLKIPKCQLSDMPDTLVHMTEYRHVRSIKQYGLLPGGVSTAGNKQRNMNHFLPIDGLLVSYEHNMRRLKKRSLSETTEEEGDDLIDLDDDDDMEVDADIPADDDDEVQVISNLDAAMVDDLAEACQKGTWVKKGTVKKEESDMPDDPSAAASSSAAVKKEEKQSTRVWSSRARSRTPSRTVLKKADNAPGAARTPSEGRRVSFSDIPETKYIEATSKKRATSRAREVISDARKAQKAPTKFHHRPDEMTCLTCANAEVLFFCRACRHGTCLDCYHNASNHCSCTGIYLCSTVPDADMPAPLGEHEREEITAEIDFTIPFAAESEGWHPDDRHVGRLHRLQEIKDLVLGGGSTGYAAMDRIVLEEVSKYHYTNHPTYRSRSIPSIAQHWDEQSDVAPYPIIRPSCYYDSNRRYTGAEMRQIVELSRSYMQGYRANQGVFDLDEARLLRSTEHVSVLLLNFGDINRTPHFNGRQPLSRDLAETDQYAVLPHYLVRNTAHITILLEANGIERHRELFNQYKCLCVLATSDGESPAIAAVCSSDPLGTSRLELIRRIELEGERLAWVAHAATFRVIWGKVEEETDGGITDDRGVRKNLRVALEEGADPANNMEASVCPDTLAVAQASTTYIESSPVDAEALFRECPTFQTGSLNDCKRMHMPELRVCAFHINAHAFQSGITAGKNAIMKILITAVADQVDVIACDANQFTNRNFRGDRHADPGTGAVLTILDQILVSANKKREPSKRITYNWEVSTLASEQLAALEGLDADCDCMLQIVLNYGKDMHTLRSRTSDIPDDRGRVGYEEPPRQKETTIKVNEFLKHLNRLDLCLKSSDLGYHHPFQCNFSLASRRKIRVRGQQSAEKRGEKNAERLERLKEQSRQKKQARQAGWHQPWSSGASSSWWYTGSSSSSWNQGCRGYRDW